MSSMVQAEFLVTIVDSLPSMPGDTALVDINGESLSDTYSDIVFKGDIDSANVEKKNSLSFIVNYRFRLSNICGKFCF